jgi:hypothetical protein
MFEPNVTNSILPVAIVCLAVFFIGARVVKLVFVGVLVFFAWTYLPASIKSSLSEFHNPLANSSSEIKDVAEKLKNCGNASVSQVGNGVPDVCKSVLMDYKADDIQKDLAAYSESASAVLADIEGKTKWK